MRRGAALALFVLLSVALCSARAQQPAPHTLRGTIQAVQPGAGSLDMITGVGMTLRLEHVEITPTTRMASGTTTLTLGDLKPGTVIRAECHWRGKEHVADRVEKVVPP